MDDTPTDNRAIRSLKGYTIVSLAALKNQAILRQKKLKAKIILGYRDKRKVLKEWEKVGNLINKIDTELDQRLNRFL